MIALKAKESGNLSALRKNRPTLSLFLEHLDAGLGNKCHKLEFLYGNVMSSEQCMNSNVKMF